MHIVIISGSHRQNSQSLRVSQYLSERLTGVIDKTITTDIIELNGNPLPLWDESMWKPEGDSDLQKKWRPYAEHLTKADALIVVSPEWSGMAPAGLKNFFLYCSAKEIGHKPAMIVTVSSSIGGAYPVTELRESSYKNTKLCYIPEHLIVRNVEKIFVGDAPASPEDDYLRNRADYTLKILVEYGKALRTVRDSGVTFDKRYPFGM